MNWQTYIGSLLAIIGLTGTTTGASISLTKLYGAKGLAASLLLMILAYLGGILLGWGACLYRYKRQLNMIKDGNHEKTDCGYSSGSDLC